MSFSFAWLLEGLPHWWLVRGSGAPVLLLLLLLPLYALLPARWTREFFISTGLVLITLLWGLPHAAGLLLAALIGYALVEWCANLPQERRKFPFAAVLAALHVAYWSCFMLPLPSIDPQLEANPPHPLNAIGIYILFSGIGLQFFRLVSYHHDRGRRGFPKAPLRDYLAYMFFFPQMLHGPVERCHDAAEKIRAARSKLGWESLIVGLRRTLWGVLLAAALGIAYERGKKPDPVLTDWLASMGMSMGEKTPDFFAEPEKYPALIFLVLLHLMPLGLYYLESMYAHLALGVGRCFGFTGVEAYFYPFGASKPCDIWHRWNMSLSNWLRDYAFLPLGGARGNRYRATFLTFFYCGLLHGLQWRNIAWGVWTGLTLGIGMFVLEWWQGGRTRRSRLRPGQKLTARQRTQLYIGRVITYEWCVLTIVFIADPDYAGLRVLWRLLKLMVGIGW
jgi:alginate O-acetyltransferase complex protein AlgI